jgi:hypothetical protein
MFGVTGLRFRTLSNWASRPWLRIRFAVWAGLWVTGHALGGFLIGGVLGWAGSTLSRSGEAVGAVLALGCVALAVRQSGWLRVPLPECRRQVQRGWMMRLPWSVVALGYGLQLGCGVATFITVSTTYAALAFTFLSGSAVRGGIIMGLFGLVRCFPPVVAAPYVASPLESLEFGARVDRYEPWILRANAILLWLTAAVLLVALRKPIQVP